jgi:cyanophycinase-like exopeptidase
MKKTLLFLILFASCAFAQSQESYTSYFTGDTADADVDPDFGVVLMGGAGENDAAMQWFLERANGGDVVVLRASGSDGYNDYLFSDLDVTVNSVETIVFNDAAAAADAYVIEQVQNAEAIWMAGGDQWNYVSYWKDNAIEDAINDLLNVRTGVVGGISAGMAVLGGSYFNAQNGTVYSEEMLSDPFNQYAELGHGDFLNAPFMQNVVTDTHYDDPDRRGRHVGFMARIWSDTGAYPKGIACDEYAAVCIDENGLAYCFGEAPQYDDYVYFVRPDCEGDVGPQVMAEGQPLTWNEGGQALKALRINATMDGDLYLDLNDWETHNGGEWFDWTVEAGTLNEAAGNAPDCAVGIQESEVLELTVYPNPATEVITVQSTPGGLVEVFDVRGTLVLQTQSATELVVVEVGSLRTGLYTVLTEAGRGTFVKQ